MSSQNLEKTFKDAIQRIQEGINTKHRRTTSTYIYPCFSPLREPPSPVDPIQCPLSPDAETSLGQFQRYVNVSPIADSSSSLPKTSTPVDHSWALLHRKTSTKVIYEYLKEM